MHSSRMHTTCLLPVFPNMHCSQGGGWCVLWGVCAPVGVCSGGVCSGGVCSRRVSAPGGVSALTGCLLLRRVFCSKGGVCYWGGCFAPKGVSAPRGCLLPEGCAPRGMSAPGGCLLPGVSVPGEGVLL